MGRGGCQICNECCDNYCHRNRKNVNSTAMSKSGSAKSPKKASINIFNIERPAEKRRRQYSTAKTKLKDISGEDSLSQEQSGNNVLQKENSSAKSARVIKSPTRSEELSIIRARNLEKKVASTSPAPSTFPGYVFSGKQNSRKLHTITNHSQSKTSQPSLLESKVRVQGVAEEEPNRNVTKEEFMLEDSSLKVCSTNKQSSRRHKSDSCMLKNPPPAIESQSIKASSFDSNEENHKADTDSERNEDTGVKQNFFLDKLRDIFRYNSELKRHHSDPTFRQKSSSISSERSVSSDDITFFQNEPVGNTLIETTAIKNTNDIHETKLYRSAEALDVKSLIVNTETDQVEATVVAGSNENDNNDIQSNKTDAIEPVNKYPNNSDDFETYILDDNEENYIVEAFNDVGRELVLTVLEISRKDVTSECYDNEIFIDDNSDMVFHKEENKDTYHEILNRSDSAFEDNIPQTEEGNDEVFVASPTEPHEKLLQHLFRKSLVTQNENGEEFIQDESSSSEGNSLDFVSDELEHIVLEEELANKQLDYEAENFEFVPGSNSDNSSLLNMRRSTICDESGNVRIEKFSSIHNTNLELSTEDSNLSKKESIKTKIDYIVEELIETEAKYVSDLEKVIYDYKPYVDNLSRIYKELAGKSSYIFGNIVSIYEYATQFNKELRKCNDSIKEIGETFLKFKPMFELYPLYSKNRPKAERYLKDFRQYLLVKQAQYQDRLGLGSYLLTPIQRLGKYILLLENILKYPPIKNTETEIVIQEALKLVKAEMRKGNDFVAIDSIKKCPIDLSIQGAFLRREKFNLLKPKKMEVMVFLFEEIVVFTTINPVVSETFMYYESIRLVDLSILCHETHPTIFHLSDFQRNKQCVEKKYTFVLEATSHKSKDQWTEAIENLLWKQLENFRSEALKYSKSDIQSQPGQFTRPNFVKNKSLRRQRAITSKRRGKRGSAFYTTM